MITAVEVSPLVVNWTDGPDSCHAYVEMVLALPEEYPQEIVDAVVAAQR